MADFAKIGASQPDETSRRIMAGIEASKKRNAELAKDVDKRRAEYEAKQRASSEAKQRASKESSDKSPVSKATTVRQHKGGGATAEVDTERIARQTKADAAKTSAKKQPAEPSRASENTSSDEGTITPKKPNPNVTYKNEPPIRVSKKEPEESVLSVMRNYGRNPKGVRDSQKKLAKGILTAPLRYLNRKTEEQLGITHSKKTSTGRRVLSSSDSEAQKEQAAKGARRTRRLGKILSKLKGVSEGEKYEEHKRTWARHHKRGLTIKDSRK